MLRARKTEATTLAYLFTPTTMEVKTCVYCP
jgi:hypothetical protein